MSCAICEARRPRRYCPGVQGHICAICCGTEREVTVDCPFDCVYLQEARRHEKPSEIAPGDVPNRDIRVTDEFLERNGPLASFTSAHIVRSSTQIPGLVDSDVREALDALIRTLRTQQSGLYYESRPNNPVAASLYMMVQAGLADFRRAEQERLGFSHTRDADVLGVLCFLQRLEIATHNGRRRSRAFIDLLRAQMPPEIRAGAPPASPLIIR
jgi:hypothetical protein